MGGRCGELSAEAGIKRAAAYVVQAGNGATPTHSGCETGVDGERDTLLGLRMSNPSYTNDIYPLATKVLGYSESLGF